MIEKIIVARLQQSAPVVAAVSTRIHPLELPQNAQLPAITYQRISTETERTLDGDNGLERPRIQVDIWTDGSTPAGYKQAKDLAALVRTAIRGSGDIGLARAQDLNEPETQRYRVSQDYIGLMAED